MAVNYGLTGVMARCTGIKRDLRLDKLETYANYYYLNFRSFIGQNGDSYDRFLIRMNEMTESLNIMNQVIYKLFKRKKNKKIKKTSDINPHYILKYLYPKSWNQNNYKNEYISMEQLINHFKY
jgi:NADH:ubiquinone oxidoreductase subunit D